MARLLGGSELSRGVFNCLSKSSILLRHSSPEIKPSVDYVYKGDTYPSPAFILLTVRMLMRPEDFFPPKTTALNIQLGNLFF